MDLTVIVLGGLAVAAVVGAWGRHHRGRAARVALIWQRAALELGLELHDEGDDEVCLTGRHNGWAVEVRRRVLGHGDTGGTTVWATVEVELDARVPRGAAIHEVARAGDETRGAVVSGDDLLDHRVAVRGERVWAHSVLDAETRLDLHRFVGEGEAFVADGVLSWGEAQHFESPELIVAVVETMTDLARRLSPPHDARAAALAAIVTSDPNPAVRCAALEVLADRLPVRDETRSAVLAALEDEDARVVRVAVAVLGTDAVERLEQRLFALPVPERDARAFTHREVLLELALSVLERPDQLALVQRVWGRPSLSLAALNVIRRGPMRELAPMLRQQLATNLALHPLARADWTASLHEIAAALGELGDTASIEVLFEALEANVAHPEVFIETLGRLGTLTDVERLQRVASRTTRRACAAAIAAIQARHGGGEAGALSLSEASDAGALSLADKGETD